MGKRQKRSARTKALWDRCKSMGLRNLAQMKSATRIGAIPVPPLKFGWPRDIGTKMIDIADKAFEDKPQFCQWCGHKL